jgi:hypothetical protein
MSDLQKPPLPWEIKAVMAVLAILCLEAVRELIVFSLASPEVAATNPGSTWDFHQYHGNSDYRITDSGTGMGMLVFLPIYIGLVIGCWLRSPLAFWMGLILAGGAGVVNLLLLLPAVRELVQPTSVLAESFHEPHERFWTIVRIVLQLSVPLLLLLARLRGRLRDWD